MNANFPRALAFVLVHEGGYGNRPGAGIMRASVHPDAVNAN